MTGIAVKTDIVSVAGPNDWHWDKELMAMVPGLGADQPKISRADQVAQQAAVNKERGKLLERLSEDVAQREQAVELGHAELYQKEEALKAKLLELEAREQALNEMLGTPAAESASGEPSATPKRRTSAADRG